MTALELRGVSKTYGEGATVVQALSGVSLSVEPGAMVAVMGPSGSGKSTLLTIAGSLEEPTSGEVLIDGAPLSRMSRNGKARLRRRSIGYVFQDFNLLPGLTAAENVALPLELDGLIARKARAAGLRALEDLGLAERAGQYPDQLSGGERQRGAGRPRGDPLGVAHVPPRVAAATAGPGADHGRRGRHHHRRGGGHEHAATGRSWLRHRTGHGHIPGTRSAPGQPDRDAAAAVRPRRRDRKPDLRHPRLDQHLSGARPEPARAVRAADALAGLRALPGRARPAARPHP